MKERGPPLFWVRERSGCSLHTTKEVLVLKYDGKQFVGIAVHRRRAVIVLQGCRR